MGAEGAITYRPSAFAPKLVDVKHGADGCLYLRSPIPLGDYEPSLCNYLRHWAVTAPDRTFLAQPSEGDCWREISYSQTWEQVRSLGQAFLNLGLSTDRPIAILSGNSIEHALVSLGGMSVGIPVVPISPNYSLLPGGVFRLAEIAEVLKPGLVFAQDSERFAQARGVVSFAGAMWASVVRAPGVLAFSDLLRTKPSKAFDVAFGAVGPNTIAKILFTSGSTGSPKGVINTQRMLCSNLVMSALVAPPTVVPTQVEWMPWHHTMGGNAAFHSVLKNGGTLCIDEGRPTPELFARTIAAIKSRPPTSLQTVPAGFALLIEALDRDPDLRTRFFSKITRVSYGGAALPDGLINKFQDLAVRTTGQKIPVMSGYGTTETAPTICLTHWPSEQSGEIGLPVPGVDLKLLPLGSERYELRVKGPNVTPGYLGRPELTAHAFDEEGFYRIGDAVSFINLQRPSEGLRFAGRLSENFKLTTGTWVLAGDLRLALLAATAPALSDIVVAGENRESIAIMAWPNPKIPEELLADPRGKIDPERLVTDPGLLSYVRNALCTYNVHQGASGRVAAFRLLSEPPSLAAGEITDKAYINQRAVLARRQDLVESMFTKPAPAQVITM